MENAVEAVPHRFWRPFVNTPIEDVNIENNRGSASAFTLHHDGIASYWRCNEYDTCYLLFMFYGFPVWYHGGLIATSDNTNALSARISTTNSCWNFSLIRLSCTLCYMNYLVLRKTCVQVLNDNSFRVV